MNESSEIVVAKHPNDKRFRDLSGQKFFRWTALSYAGKIKGSLRWNCLCECGRFGIIASTHLTRGNSKSCGCFNRDSLIVRSRRHGWSRLLVPREPEYNVWCHIKARCLNPKDKSFDDYGGRGIKVSERWMKFENFIEDMGTRPSSLHSIDRLDNDGDYEKENCRWRTKTEQARNKRNTRRITLWGFTGTIMQIVERFRIDEALLHSRFYGNAMHLYPSHPPCAIPDNEA